MDAGAGAVPVTHTPLSLSILITPTHVLRPPAMPCRVQLDARGGARGPDSQEDSEVQVCVARAQLLVRRGDERRER